MGCKAKAAVVADTPAILVPVWDDYVVERFIRARTGLGLATIRRVLDRRLRYLVGLGIVKPDAMRPPVDVDLERKNHPKTFSASAVKRRQASTLLELRYLRKTLGLTAEVIERIYWADDEYQEAMGIFDRAEPARPQAFLTRVRRWLASHPESAGGSQGTQPPHQTSFLTAKRDLGPGRRGWLEAVRLARRIVRRAERGHIVQWQQLECDVLALSASHPEHVMSEVPEANTGQTARRLFLKLARRSPYADVVAAAIEIGYREPSECQRDELRGFARCTPLRQAATRRLNSAGRRRAKDAAPAKRTRGPTPRPSAT